MSQDDIDIDIEYLQTWIGNTEINYDSITSILVDKFNATLHNRLWQSEGPNEDNVPLGLHWCLAPAIFNADQLGQDGHPKRGGFLPPVPLPSRMWAGGEITFMGKFRVGDIVARQSKIANVSLKEGKTGALVFVNVEHEYWVDTRLIIVERHDIVYKTGPEKNKKAVIKRPEFAPEFGLKQNMIVLGEIDLFRYSAITFNGHRIHYDRTYAQQEEGYEGLVIHGPLQATLLMNETAKLCGAMPQRFAYRGVAPLIEQTPFHIGHEPTGTSGTLWCEDFTGRITMQSHYHLY